MIQKSMRHVDSNSSNASNSGDDNDDYRLKREKNNESVRKSRLKNRLKIQDCAARVQQLNAENYQLNKKLETLNLELVTLKNLFQHSISFNKFKTFNPNEISTANLYKLIMKNDFDSSSTNGGKLAIESSQKASAN